MAQYPNLFIIWYSTSVPNLVLSSQNAQFGQNIELTCCTRSESRSGADSLSHCGLTDAVTARSLPVTAAYINHCFITGHILWAFISSINHSSLLISWFICAIFQTWIINKLSRGTSSPACWWMENSVDRKPVFSSPSSGVSVQRADFGLGLRVGLWLR